MRDSISVSTPQQECYPGSEVEGTVSVHVANKTASRVELRLVGLAESSSMVTPAFAQFHSTEKKELISQDVELHATSFGNEGVAPGAHSFPFSVALPRELPSTMEERRLGDFGRCAIRYFFDARLVGLGRNSEKSLVECQETLKILAIREEIDDAGAMPVVAGPTTEVVKNTCCCRNQNMGSIVMGVMLDRSVVGLGQTVEVSVVARNDSSATVKAMRVEIVQVCSWSVQSQGRQKYVLRQKEELKLAVEVASNPELSASDDQDLQALLAAGDTTRFELLVPGDALLPVQLDNIEVKHFVLVTLATSGFDNSPEVSIPLRVINSSGRQHHMTGTEASTREAVARDAAPGHHCCR